MRTWTPFPAPHASPPEDASADSATEERQPLQDEAERMTLRSDTALSHTRSASRAINASRAEATKEKKQQWRDVKGKSRSKDGRHGYYALPFATDQPEYSLTDDERDDTDNADSSEEVEKFQTGQRTRRQRQAKGQPLQLPMVEVAGPEGPILVHRMTTVFEANGGIPKDDMTGASASTYEHHLCGHIFRGLRSDVAAKVKHSYVGGEDEPRLTELRRHARHAQSHLDEKKSKREEKQNADLYNVALTLYKAVANPHGGFHNRDSWRGRSGENRQDRGHYQQQQQSRRDRDACFVCGDYGHWRGTCPNRGRRGDRQQQRRNYQRLSPQWEQAD